MFASRKAGVVFLSWFSLLLWMAFIFLMSSKTGEDSSDLSGSVVTVIGAFVRLIVPNISEYALHFLVRKGAHVFEYMVLSMLFVNALRQHIERKDRVYIYAIFFSILYAATDEIHQVFVENRAGTFLDVGIDTLGVLLGVLVFEGVVQVFKPWRSGI